MINLLFVRISLCIRLAYTLRDHTRIALRVASIFTVLALHARGILEEIAAQRTSHNVIELLLDELVAVHLVNFLLPLPNGALATKSSCLKAVWCVALEFVLLCETDGQVDRTRWLKSEPRINRLWWNNTCTR